MKYFFDKNKIKIKYRPYIIINSVICIVLIAANRLYNTLSGSSKLTEPLILLLVFFAASLCAILFIRHIEYRTYKDGFISIHKGKIKYRKNNMQNFWSEFYYYPDFEQYKIDPASYVLNDKKIVLFGNISLSLLNENEYEVKSMSVSKIKIPAYYDDWQKVIEKIANIVNK